MPWHGQPSSICSAGTRFFPRILAGCKSVVDYLVFFMDGAETGVRKILEIYAFLFGQFHNGLKERMKHAGVANGEGTVLSARRKFIVGLQRDR